MIRRESFLAVGYRIAAILVLLSACSGAQAVAPPPFAFGFDWRPLNHHEWSEVCSAISEMALGLGFRPGTPPSIVSAAQASASVMQELKWRGRVWIVDPQGFPGEGTGGFTSPTRVAIGDEVGFGSQPWMYYDPEFGSGQEHVGLGGALLLISDPALRRCHLKAILAHEAQRVCMEVCAHPDGVHHQSVWSEKEWLEKTILAYEIGYWMLHSCSPPGWPDNRAANADNRLHATLLLGTERALTHYRARLSRIRCPE